MSKKKPVKAPGHLSQGTAAWWSTVTAEFELESHHVMLLTLCAEAWDRKERARQSIAELGETFTDRFGQPRNRPEIATIRDAEIGFARYLRELGLDVSVPETYARSKTIAPNAHRRTA